MTQDQAMEKRIADLQSKYGVKLDKVFLTMTEIIRDEVVIELKKQDRPIYQMGTKGQAFLYGLGKNLWLSVIVLSILVLTLVWYFFVSENYRYREASINSLSREQRQGLETFKGIILNTWGTGRITTYTPVGSTKPLEVIAIPKSSVNKLEPAGLSYYEDNQYIYVRLR
jgi:hypothetical protein